MQDEVYFRVGVGILVVDRQGRVLAAERSDHPGSWQAPQGGLRPDEEPAEAAARELNEEVGISWSSVQILAEHPTWIGYELPPDARSERNGRGQVHKWFLVRYLGSDLEVDTLIGDAPEFRAWRWLWMPELVRDAWPLKRAIYGELARIWSDLIGKE